MYEFSETSTVVRMSSAVPRRFHFISTESARKKLFWATAAEWPDRLGYLYRRTKDGWPFVPAKRWVEVYKNCSNNNRIVMTSKWLWNVKRWRDNQLGSILTWNVGGDVGGIETGRDSEINSFLDVKLCRGLAEDVVLKEIQLETRVGPKTCRWRKCLLGLLIEHLAYSRCKHLTVVYKHRYN